MQIKRFKTGSHYELEHDGEDLRVTHAATFFNIDEDGIRRMFDPLDNDTQVKVGIARTGIHQFYLYAIYKSDDSKYLPTGPMKLVDAITFLKLTCNCNN